MTACLLFAVLLAFGCSYKSPFTDQALDQRFRSNQADFERLAKMLREDSTLSGVNHRAAYLSYDRKATLPQERLDEYQSLLRKLNVRSVTRGEKTGNIYLPVWHGSDFLAGGSTESYVYAESPPEGIAKSLDDLRKNTDAYAYKRIAENWYLHIDNW